MLGSPVLSGKENLACALATLAVGDFERGDRYEEIRTQVGALVDMVLDQRRTRAESKRMAAAAELLAPVIVNDRTMLILGGKTIWACGDPWQRHRHLSGRRPHRGSRAAQQPQGEGPDFSTKPALGAVT